MAGSHVYGNLTNIDKMEGVQDYAGMIESSVEVVRDKLTYYLEESRRDGLLPTS